MARGKLTTAPLLESTSPQELLRHPVQVHFRVSNTLALLQALSLLINTFAYSSISTHARTPAHFIHIPMLISLFSTLVETQAYNSSYELTDNLSSDGWNQLAASCGLFAVSIMLILFIPMPVPIIGPWLRWLGWRVVGLFFLGAVIFGYIGRCTRDDNSTYSKTLQDEAEQERIRRAYDEYLRQQYK